MPLLDLGAKELRRPGAVLELLGLLRTFKDAHSSDTDDEKAECDTVMKGFTMRTKVDISALAAKHHQIHLELQELIDQLEGEGASANAAAYHAKAIKLVESMKLNECREKVLVVSHGADLDVTQEVAAIKARLGLRGDILDHKADASWGAFAGALERDPPYSLVQLSMHTAGGKLLFRAAEAGGAGDDVRGARQLGHLFKTAYAEHPGVLRAVLLMACNAPEIATVLHDAGVPAVIFCTEDLADEAACLFSPEFIRQLVVLQREVPDAFRRAKEHTVREIGAREEEQQQPSGVESLRLVLRDAIPVESLQLESLQLAQAVARGPPRTAGNTAAAQTDDEVRLTEVVMGVLAESVEPIDVLEVRRKFSELQQPDTRQLNRILYDREAAGALQKLQPNPNKKPKWRLTA